MNVTLTSDVWERMKAYVDLCNEEISGLGKVERDGDNFRIVDIALFEQTVSAAHSDITAEALAKFQVELIRKNESLEDWNFWWHSHAKMGVFFSGTDTGTIDSSTEFKYLVSLVTNHKHEFTARVDIYEPVRMYKMLDVEIEEQENQAVLDACQKEIDEKVSRPAVTTYGHVPYRSKLFDDNYPQVKRHVGFTSEVLTDDEDDSKPSISTADELEKALRQQGDTMLGTDTFALAIEVWENLMQEVETEIDYYESNGNSKQLKKAKKELKKLKKIGHDYSLNVAYDS